MMRSAFATFFANSGFAIYIYILIYIPDLRQKISVLWVLASVSIEKAHI